MLSSTWVIALVAIAPVGEGVAVGKGELVEIAVPVGGAPAESKGTAVGAAFDTGSVGKTSEDEQLAEIIAISIKRCRLGLITGSLREGFHKAAYSHTSNGPGKNSK